MSKSLPKDLLIKYRDLIYSQYGIQYHGSKVENLQMKLLKLANYIDCSLVVFYDLLVLGNKKAVDTLLREITIGHTYFFREEEHLSYLVKDIMHKKTVSPLIWCAASSTGEEPYSIIISLLENKISRFTLVSSDVNQVALKAMHRGIYHTNQLQKTDKRIKRTYFDQLDAYTWKVKPKLRSYLKIKNLNLHTDISFEEEFDYIFCRNVMIYFDEEGRRKVLENIFQNMKHNGLLFVGHSEAMLPLPCGLKKEAAAVFRRTS